jgi:hypothetical protein
MARMAHEKTINDPERIAAYPKTARKIYSVRVRRRLKSRRNRQSAGVVECAGGARVRAWAPTELRSTSRAPSRRLRAGSLRGYGFRSTTRTVALVARAAVVCAISAMIVVVNAAKVGLVAASWVDDASVIGDASYRGAGVSANDADERVRAVGIATSGAHRICAAGQSARNEKSGQRYFDRRTHDDFPRCVDARERARRMPGSITLQGPPLFAGITARR